MIKTEKRQGFLIEELDPRMKILIVMLLSVMCFTSVSQKAFLWESVLIVLLFWGRGLFWQGLKVGAILGVAVFAELATDFILADNLRITVHLIVFLLGRFVVVFVMCYWMSLKMRVGDFVTALQKMYIPKGLTITFAVVFRYMPTVKDEFGKIYNTMKLRGIAPNIRNLTKHPVKTCEYAIVPLIIRSLTIADQLATSAITRGMDMENQKTSYRTVKIELWDILVTLCIIALAMYGLKLEG